MKSNSQLNETRNNFLKQHAFTAKHKRNEAANVMICATSLPTSTKAKLMVANMLVNSVLRDLEGGR